ncbi:hypothetical protein DY000_02033448 [Brassica cretica]|uniref:Uncharacterized protein n=1 Tax=Brassica cretica TaxID=69181 RepID=A0ABQ7DY17_BRACR|nr:hypothetical protein DY000_02033448 [Brassica cretica]
MKKIRKRPRAGHRPPGSCGKRTRLRPLLPVRLRISPRIYEGSPNHRTRDQLSETKRSPDGESNRVDPTRHQADGELDEVDGELDVVHPSRHQASWMWFIHLAIRRVGCSSSNSPSSELDEVDQTRGCLHADAVVIREFSA